VTVSRLVAWMLVWLAGWALFLIHPVSNSGAGTVLLVVVSPAMMMTPRQWKEDGSVRRLAIVLLLLVLLFLLLIFVLPPSYTWQFPEDPRFVAGLKAFAVLVAVFGICVNWRRFVQGLAGTA
jgi:hypothetical protein